MLLVEDDVNPHLWRYVLCSVSQVSFVGTMPHDGVGRDVLGRDGP